MVYTYDIIIIGGGTAGCILANKLSQNKNTTVLVLEAGPDYRDNKFPKVLKDPDIVGGDKKHSWDYKSGSIELPAAKVIGGSSAHNACAILRGRKSDYAKWQQYVEQGWTWPEILKTFKHIEITKCGSDKYRGRDGILPVVCQKLKSNKSFVSACMDLGFKYIEDFNGPTQDGVGLFQTNIKNNVRQNTALLYLTSNVRQRSNLTIKGHAQVDKIIFKHTTAVGVKLIDNDNIYYACREIILCAGTYGSPTILLRPKRDLKQLDIKCIADLPVGKRLMDHPLCVVDYGDNKNHNPEEALLWTQSNSAKKQDTDLMIFQLDSGIGIALVVPDSTGTLTLSSKNPKVLPKINSNFLTKQSDRQRLIDGIELAREIAYTASIPLKKQSNQQILDTVESFCHGTSTNSMGEVVDWQGRVYGTKHLRVVDASIIPVIPSNPTNMTVMMMAEYISNFIQTTHACKN
jgi:choline dehydrogenase